MSVAFGLDPAALLELDGAMIDALERAAEARWLVADELAAQTLELSHVHYRTFLGAHGVKAGRLPPPLRVPRPSEDGFDKPPVLSPLAFATEYGPSSSSKPEAAA